MSFQSLETRLHQFLKNHADPINQNCGQQFLEFLQKYPTQCFDRDLSYGHVTGSAWLLHPEQEHVLLTHHKKLNIWIQLGGHADSNPNILDVAHREAYEESGIEKITPFSQHILGIDIHQIPARGSVPAHLHHDVCFAFQAHSENYEVSEESHELAWVRIDQLEKYTNEASLLRLREHWYQMEAQQ